MTTIFDEILKFRNNYFYRNLPTESILKVPFGSLFYVKRTETRYKRRGKKRKCSICQLLCELFVECKPNSGVFLRFFCPFVSFFRFVTGNKIPHFSYSWICRFKQSAASIVLLYELDFPVHTCAMENKSTCNMRKPRLLHCFASVCFVRTETFRFSNGFSDSGQSYRVIFENQSPVVSYLEIDKYLKGSVRDENNSCRFLSFCRKI